MTLLALLACAPAPDAPASEAPAASPLVPLDAARLARRVSLDVRGVLPTAAELDAVEADPAALAGLEDAWLADPRFEDRLVALFAEQWHTRVDAFDVDWYDFPLEAQDEFRFEQSVGEEPLRLLAHVATTDAPWTDVVTADYTVANELLASIWPLDNPEGGEGWQVARWTDGRPAAGVLASNGLWWRYSTNPFNENRRRAAAIFRLLVCEDFPARPVSFGASSEEFAGAAAGERIDNDPYCLACHAAIEPVASALYGFWWFRQYSPTEMVIYHAEREQLGAETMAAPAWFGEPVDGLADLGRHIAADGRFSECAARTMATGLWRRQTTIDDQPRIDALEADFVAGGMRMSELVRALIDGEEYRAGGVTDAASDTVRDREITRRLLAPDQLGTVLGDLTGWRWEHSGYDQLANDTFGYRILANGVDGEYVTVPAQDPTLTWSLVTTRSAQAAAYTVVTHDLVSGESPRRLFSDAIALDTPSTDPAFEAELAALHWRLLGRRADADDLAALVDLWNALAPDAGAEGAWRGVVAALFQHPEFLSY